MTKKMKIILGLVVAAGVVAGAISYKNANTTSPEIQEVERNTKLNPVGPALMPIRRWLIVPHNAISVFAS